jgi:hypothetical protein
MRVRFDYAEDALDLRDELHLEFWPPGRVPVGRFGQFGNRLW